MAVRDLAYFLCLLTCFQMIKAQAAGKTYYVSMLGRDNSTIPSQPNSLLLIVNNQNAVDITVTITGSNCNQAGDHVVTSSDSSSPIPITLNCPGLIPTGIEIASKGLKVMSDSDFQLHVVQVDDSLGAGSRTQEGYLAFESEHLGDEYYVITYCQTGGWCQFSVLATENTSLNIRFPRDVTANASCLTSSGSTVVSGTSVPFYLSALDILHIESQQDLSGTYISSDNIVAVYAGARNVPATNSSGGTVRHSHFMEQMLPTNKWGKEFIVMPNDMNDYGDLINIVTKHDNTRVEILGFSPFVIPVAGDSTIRRIDWGMNTYIETDKPVAIAQFLFINLYNNVNQTELPSMVWVQAKNQMPNEHYFYAYAGYLGTGSTVSVSASSESSGLQKTGIDPTATASGFFDSSTPMIERSDSKAHHQQILGFSRLHGANASAYGYIAGNIAMLGGIRTEESEECEISSGYPGDQVDNDCDNMVDEDVCTEADLGTTYYLPYDQHNLSAPIFTQIVDIGSQDTFYFNVVTCGLLQIGLRSTEYDRSTSPTSKFAALQVSQTYILLESCNPNCNQDDTVDVSGITDCATQSIDFKLTLGGGIMTVKVGGNTGSVPITGLTVDRLLLMSLVRESNVTMDSSTKDCGKIISGEEDNYGKDFVIPYQTLNGATITDSYVFVTNKGGVAANLQIFNAYGAVISTTALSVDANASTTFSHSQIGPQGKFVRLRSNVEISVQFMYHTAGTHTTALMLLPTDILGPSYHYHFAYSDTNLEIRNLIVPPMENKAVDDLTQENEPNFEPVTGEQTLIEATIPFVAFNGYKKRSFVQLQPKEHLGKHFFIPAIDLTVVGATGTLFIITTEDSTYFKVLGEYHQDTIEDYKGSVHQRSLYTNQLFEIEANKPVQVMLEIKATDDTWGSLLIIPHLNQYTELTVFPKLDPTTFDYVYSSGVSRDPVTDSVTEFTPFTTLPQTASDRHISQTGHTYFLVFVKDVSSSRKFVLSSDLKFNSLSNNLCVLTAGTPGDSVDNDCDNLMDEESCTAFITLGGIDPDIDGAINDDCKANTTPYVNNAPVLALSSNTTTCPTPATITTSATPAPGQTTAQPPALVVHKTLDADWYSNLVYPPLPPTQAPPSFDPIESTTTTPAPSTTAASGSTGTPGTTVAPEETCTTDCVCPCGWVQEKNYTQEELKAVVVEIQEKLKLSKNKLSSSLRKKTSAPDDRPSATAVGFAGFVFLIVTIGAMVLLDVSSIIRDLRMLRTNLQEVFNI